jgi:transketolase
VSRPLVPVTPLHAAPRRSVRTAYGETLAALGDERHDIVVLEADVGASTRSCLFGARHPERYFNVGIAEGNMMAMAAGFAACGKVPFVNTFAVFATLRAADPLRSLVAYARLNVKIAAAYGGLSDSYDGATHQSVEDLAIARSLPHLAVVVPTDAAETAMAVKAAADYPGPVYLRLSRADLPVICRADHPFAIGRGNVLKEGGDVTLVACGYMVIKSLEAAGLLEKCGVAARVLELPTLKPLDEGILLEAARETGRVVTIEEHSVVGGLGAAVAEFLVQQCPVPMRLLGIPDCFGASGDYEALLAKFGLDAAGIADQVLRFLAAPPR